MKKNWKDCKDLGERLSLALDQAKVTMADLARELGVSSAAISKWAKNDTKNLRSENLFGAAKFLKVNAEWLATGTDSPYTGIPSLYKDISGPYLKIAKELTDLDDKDLRAMIIELIDAKKAKPLKKKNVEHKENGELHAQ